MAAYIPPRKGNDLVFNPSNFDYSLEGISLQDADKRYLKLGGGSLTGSLNLSTLSASTRVEVESTDATPITSTTNCDEYGLHLHSILSSSNGRYPGSAIAFNNSSLDNVPLSSISLDKISNGVGQLVFAVRYTSDCNERLRITNDGIKAIGSVICDQIILTNGTTDSDWLTQFASDVRYLRKNNASGDTMQGGLTVSKTSNGNSFSSINGSSACKLYHYNNGTAIFGTTTNNDLEFQTNGVIRAAFAGNNGVFTVSNQIYINGYTSNTVPSNRRYGYSGSDPSNQAGGTVNISLRTSNDVWVSGNVYCSSDRRLKTNIKQWDASKCMNLLDVNPYMYSWKRDESENLYLGFIAQDLIKNGCDDLVQCFQTDDEDIGHCSETNIDGNIRYAVEYQKIPLYLLEIIKHQQNQIKKQDVLLRALIDILPKARRKQFDTLMSNHQIENLSDIELDGNISS